VTQAIPEGISRPNVLAALSDLDAGTDHEFGESVGYDLIYEGKRYPPKAVLGIAARHAANVRLGPYDFKGGQSSKCFRILRDLGFAILKKEAIGERKDWTEDEVRLLVADYFSMLADQETGKPYVKAEHRRALLPRLDGRTEASVEFKHRNVSAVLFEMKYAYLRGYLPASNAQTLLEDIVREYLGTETEIVNAIERAAEEVSFPIEFSSEVLAEAFEAAPPGPDLPEVRPHRTRQPRRFDFRAKDEANRRLGRAGEEFAIAYERWRLTHAGRADLAERIVWLSDVAGDGAGYDIESFEPDGTKIYIEVKTTKQGNLFPFLISANEVDASSEIGASFRLYRVFEFGPRPRLYILRGAITSGFTLLNITYEARLQPGADNE
jgi:hypothetical protein